MGGSILAAAYGLLAFMPHWGWTLPACLALGFGFYTLHNTLQLQATQIVPGSTGLALSTFTAAMFVGQSVGASLAALGASRLGPD